MKEHGNSRAGDCFFLQTELTQDVRARRTPTPSRAEVVGRHVHEGGNVRKELVP